MNRTFLAILLPGALLVTRVAVQADPPPPIKAKVLMTSKQIWEAELKGRRGKLVTMSKVGEKWETDMAPEDIAQIEFPFDLDESGAGDLLMRGEYKAAADLLTKGLRPSFAYLDITNNIADSATVYLRCLYWSEQYRETMSVAEEIDRRVFDSHVKSEAKLYQVLAMLGQGYRKEAEKALVKIGPVTDEESFAPMYYFSKATLEFNRGEVEKAQETTARLIGLHCKDFDWMPAGLYLSAQGYMMAKAYPVSEQILGELQRFYPRSPWVKQIPELRKQIAENQAADEKERREKGETKAEEPSMETYRPSMFDEPVNPPPAKSDAKPEEDTESKTEEENP